MFCGVHLTKASVVAKLPEGECCSVRQGYIPWIGAGKKVSAFISDSNRFFAENSTPERYWQSNMDMLNNATLRFPPPNVVGISPRAKLDPTAIIREPVSIGPGATIEAGATVGPFAVVGENATVAAGITLSHSVLWADTKVTASKSNAIVTPNTTVSISV